MIADSSGIGEQLIGSWIAAPVPVGESGCEVLRLDDREGQAVAYLKHGKGSLGDAVADEMIRLRWLHARLPVPEIIRFVATQDECWLMTRALAGESARALLDERPDDRDLLIDELADFLRLIHALPAIECPFDARLERRLNEGRARIEAGLVDESDFDHEQEGWSAQDVWDAIQTHLPLEPDLVVTHGDFSLDNRVDRLLSQFGLHRCRRAGGGRSLSGSCGLLGRFGGLRRARSGALFKALWDQRRRAWQASSLSAPE